MALKAVIAFFAVAAILRQVSAQPNDRVRADLQDPTWEVLRSAMNQLNPSESNTRVRIVSLFSIAAFDTMASYSYRMDGLVVGGTLRRPFSFRTIQNKRVSIAYAVYRTLTRAFGEPAKSAFDQAFTTLNLNPNITSTDARTAAGFGNLVGQRVIDSIYFDQPKLTQSIQVGTNGRRRVISKWTPYTPVNNAYELKDFIRWQPLEVVINNNEYPVVQAYYADMWSYFPLITAPLNFTSPANYSIAAPTEMLNYSNPGYKAQVDRILRISAGLNDDLKMKAEGIDGGFGDDAFTFLINKYNFNLDRQIVWQFAFGMAARESLIVSAYYKRVYDLIRPVSAVRLTTLYDKVTAWAGPYRGTQTINAVDFRQYNSRTDPSPEYPSGACSYYGSWTTTASRLLGTPTLGWSVTFEAGSSRIEPGLTPRIRTVINFPTFADQRRICMEGREAGGVHYQIGAQSGLDVGQLVGAQVYNRIGLLIKVTRILSPQLQ